MGGYTMKLTRADLLRAAQKNGYDGKPDLEAIKAWAEAKGIDFDTGDQTIDEIWATKATIGVEGDEGAKAAKAMRPVSKADEVTATLVDGEKAGARSMSPGGLTRLAARKRYERRANLPEGHKGRSVFSSADEAEGFGAWFRMTIAGANDYAEKQNDREIAKKNQITTTNTAGGALVPEIYQATLIDLKEQYGIARQLAAMFPMQNDTLTMPRRTGGLTVYAPGEASEITASTAGWDNVSLTARKMGTLTYISSELMNDAAFNVADLIAKEIAYAFTKKEDEILLNGDATATYFGFTGIREKLKGLSGTIANIAGLQVGTGNAYSELTLADFHGVQGRAPEYVDANRPVWVMNKRFWANVIQPLQLAKGGVTYEEIANKKYRSLNGDPILFSPAMPRVEGNSQVCALYGAFSMGAAMGEVTGSMSIATSEHAAFTSDRIAVRGLQRVAFNVHDVGNADASDDNRVPGPIVGLITAAS